MKKIKLLFLILTISSMLFSLTTSNTKAHIQQETIKIGLLGPLDLRSGYNMEKGAKLAVKEINAAGGVMVGGTAHDFELIIETTSSPTTGLPDPSIGITSVNKLQDQDNVVAMLGLYRNEVAIAVITQLNRPFLGVGITGPIITPFFWRVGTCNGSRLTTSLLDLYGLGLMDIGVRNVSIVREAAGWAAAMSNSIVYYLNNLFPTLGYTTAPINFTSDVVIEQAATYATVESALVPIKSELDGLDVNAAMPIFSGPVGKHITSVWAASNMTQILAGINVECQSSTFFKETEGAAYGEITLMNMPPDVNQTSKTRQFKQAFYDEYGKKSTVIAAASYDSVYVIKDAIERADSYVSSDIQIALNETNYEGANYRIKFTSEPNVWTHPIWGYPFGHVAFYDNGSRYLIPGVPTNLMVHDLYTTSNFAVSGVPYSNGYWVQWQQDGIQKTIWGEDPVATRDISDHFEWPVNHSNYDTMPPLITSVQHSPSTPTSVDNMQVYADITDFSDIQSAKIHYRVINNPWQVVTMIQKLDNTYSANLGTFNVNDTVQYYVSAMDGSSNHNEATDDNAGNYYSFNVSTPISTDITLPVISNIHHSPSNPTPTDAVRIYAEITDLSGIQSATVHYRVINNPWQVVTMIKQSDNTYSANLGAFDNGDTVQYYVIATDGSSNYNTATNDNNGNYYSFSVLIPTTTVESTTSETSEPLIFDSPMFFHPLELLVLGLTIIFFQRITKK
jgi:branched-chain amino acid transport system substrate-binding protein